MHNSSQSDHLRRAVFFITLLSTLLLGSNPVKADVTVFVTTDGNLPLDIATELELAARDLEAELEAAGGLINGSLDLTSLATASPVGESVAVLRLDGLQRADGITQMEFSDPFTIGTESSRLLVSVDGPDARLIAHAGLDLPATSDSGLEVLNGGQVIAYGPIAYNRELYRYSGLIDPLRVAGEGSRLTSVATAANPTGGRISFNSPYEPWIRAGGVVEALSEIGPDNGAGTITIGPYTLLQMADSGSQLNAQYQISLVSTADQHHASALLELGAEIRQLQSNGFGPGLVLSQSSMGVFGASRIVTVDDIMLHSANGVESSIGLYQGGSITTESRIIIGDTIDDNAGGEASLFFREASLMTAQEIVVNQQGRLFGDTYFEPEYPQPAGAGQIDADVILNGGTFVPGAYDVNIDGTLDARNGTLELRVADAAASIQPLLTVSESVLFGENSLLRVLVDSIPAGGEVLLDRYLLADRYEFTPQFMLSAQLEPVVAAGLLAAGEQLLFRFSDLNQTYIYEAPGAPNVVPELNAATAPLAFALLLAVGALVGERRRDH